MDIKIFTELNGTGPFALFKDGLWCEARIEGGAALADGAALDLSSADGDSVSACGDGFILLACPVKDLLKGGAALGKLTGRRDLMLWHDHFDRKGRLAKHSLERATLRETAIPHLYEADVDGDAVSVFPGFVREKAQNGCGDYLFWRVEDEDGAAEEFSLYILDKKFSSDVAGYRNGVSLVHR